MQTIGKKYFCICFYSYVVFFCLFVFYTCVSMDKKHDYKNVNPQIAVRAGTGRCMIFSEELSAMWEKKGHSCIITRY